MSIASNFPSSLPSLLLDFANVKRLDPRITFTRTTTATYYDGVTTAVAEQNLLTYSQEFDNAVWNPQSSSVTSNAVSAPDGTMTADKLVSQSAAGIYPRLRRLNALSNKTQTVSVYAKKAEWSYMSINQDGAYIVYYDLNAGTVVSADTSTGTITSVGNGWFRCTYSYTSTFGGVTQQLAIMAGNTATYGAQTGDGTSGIYLWGAQLEDRSSATAYTATTTQAITNYIPVLQTAAAGQARFDHNPTTGESLGLLIEEARTNLLTYSQQLTLWNNASSAVVVDNAVVSPDGTIDASTFTDTTASSQHYMTKNATVVSGTSYTFSVYVKSYQLQGIALRIITATTVAQSYFNLSAGTITVSAGTATITNVGNGWYRCTLTGIADSTTAAVYINLLQTPSSTTLSYSGTGTGLFIWGAQLEAGSFATSYIPTVASSVTRNADAASMTGTNFSSWFNNGEGTVYFEAQPMYVGTGVSSLNSWLWDGTTNNFIGIGQNNSYGNGVGIDGIVRVNGSNTVYGSTTTGVTTSSAFKVTMAYEVDNTGSYLNGASFIADTSCTIPVVNQWKFSGNYVSGNTSNGWVRKLSYYPQRLSATNLAALTT